MRSAAVVLTGVIPLEGCRMGLRATDRKASLEARRGPPNGGQLSNQGISDNISKPSTENIPILLA
jgi:hypothetical protein